MNKNLCIPIELTEWSDILRILQSLNSLQLPHMIAPYFIWYNQTVKIEIIKKRYFFY